MMTSIQSSKDAKEEDICFEDERTNSALAHILLQIASVISIGIDPKTLGQALGFSESQVVEIDHSYEESKDKVLHILQRYVERRGEDWLGSLTTMIKDQLQKPDLAQEVQDVTTVTQSQNSSTCKQQTEDVPVVEKGSMKDISFEKPGTPTVSQDLRSDRSEWEMPSGGTQEGPLSPSFERVSEENVFKLRDGEQASHDQDHHASLDHPEMSLHISTVANALQTVCNLLGNPEGIRDLPQVVPQLFNLARKMRSQKELRTVFEEENVNLKQGLDKANETIREQRVRIEKLESENAELKKAKEDKTLNSFEYVTRKEAHDIKEEEKKEHEKAQQAATPPSSEPSGGVSIQAYESLQKKIISLKQKLAHVVKLNHSWDDQYHRMEAALRQEIDKAKQEVAMATAKIEEKKQDWMRREKDRDEILVSAKQRVEQAEKEKAEMQLLISQLNEQNAKLNRYTVSLQEFKQDLETEVKRLNEALEQKVHISEKASRPAPSQAPVKQVAAAAPAKRAQKEKFGGPRELTSHQERSVLESMPRGDLIEELGLLKQQVDVYKSDFYKEQRDRQRAMGELDEIKTELHRTKKKMEKQKQQMQILQDQALAYEYQANETKMAPPPLPRRPKQAPKTRLSQQDLFYNMRQGPRSPPYSQQVRSPPFEEEQDHIYESMHAVGPPSRYEPMRPRQFKKDLLPHGVNYAMNDEYIDAYEEPFEDLEVYLPPDTRADKQDSDEDMYLSPSPSPTRLVGAESRSPDKYAYRGYEK